MSLFDTIEEQSEMQFPNIDELDKKTMLKMEKQLALIEDETQAAVFSKTVKQIKQAYRQ